MAGTTRLELATSAVTGQRSNQLNYVPTRQINDLPENLAGQGSQVSHTAHPLPVLPAVAAVPAKTTNQPLSNISCAHAENILTQRIAAGPPRAAHCSRPLNSRR